MTRLRILHLSDTHVLAGGVPHNGAVDTVATYRSALESFAGIGPLDIVVVSGDVSDDGTPESYRSVQSLTGDFAARHGAVAFYTMGNHDQRPGFREVLGNGHPFSVGSASADAPNPGTPVTGVSEVAGFRIITLDTSVPGRTHGYLDPEQLQWLAAQLAADSVHGTVLVIHHPPVEPVTALHHGIQLMNPGSLPPVLAGSDVVAILSGHYHHALMDSFDAGDRLVPVSVAPGVVNLNDVLAGTGHERATVGSGGTLLELTAVSRSTARMRAMPLGVPALDGTAPAEIFDLGPDEVHSIAGRIAVTDTEIQAMEQDLGMPLGRVSTTSGAQA